MGNREKIGVALAVVLAVHGVALLAGFLAPYGPSAQDRWLPFAPPTRVHFVDAQGKLHLRPFAYRWMEKPGSPGAYEEDRTKAYPLKFFVRSGQGNPGAGWRLFGVEEPARILLMGSDGYGRDQFSRWLYGGRISLLAGLLAAALSLSLGLIAGSVAGFYGRWADEILMGGAELFLALPWLYLLFAVRAFLPLHITPAQAFLMLVAVIGLVGWARPARLVRGIVLSAKARDYVLAARGFGASDAYLLRRHVLPQAYGVMLTQAALLVPQYVLAEVTLSFLGLGVGEPVPSWGNMLASLQEYHVLASYWWMFLPGIALVPLFLAYHALANALQTRAKVTTV